MAMWSHLLDAAIQIRRSGQEASWCASQINRGHDGEVPLSDDHSVTSDVESVAGEPFHWITFRMMKSQSCCLIFAMPSFVQSVPE